MKGSCEFSLKTTERTDCYDMEVRGVSCNLMAAENN